VKKRNGIVVILTDLHFWVPLVALAFGIALLAIFH